MFNIIKELFSYEGEKTYAAWNMNYDRNRPETTHIIKYHKLLPELAEAIKNHDDNIIIKTMLSKRDLRDAIASYIGMGWANDGDPLINHVSRIMEHYTSWLPYGDYLMRYEDYITAPVAEIGRIAHVLNLPHNPERDQTVFRAVDSLDNEPDSTGSKQYDRNPGHRQGGEIGRYKRDLPQDEISEIETRFGDWLIANGYSLSGSDD